MTKKERFRSKLHRVVLEEMISTHQAAIRAHKAKIAVLQKEIRALSPPPDGGRVSRYTGKTIVARCKDSDGHLINPRRKGTHGHRSHQVILDAGGEITFMEFKEQGGRTKDLRWDLDRDFVKLADTTAC